MDVCIHSQFYRKKFTVTTKSTLKHHVLLVSWDIQMDLTVNLDRVSHRIVSLAEDGTNFRGKAQILDTPMGKIASSLLGEGVKLGVSSRGMGSIDKREDVNVVMDDFMLATAADIVADPSAPDAFVNGIMEGKEWAWDNGILKETKVAKYQSYMNNATRRNLEERTLRVFEDFLSGL